MESNKENEDKNQGKPQYKVTLQKLKSRRPLTDLALQRVNQDLAGPSRVQTPHVSKSFFNENYPQSLAKKTGTTHPVFDNLTHCYTIDILTYLIQVEKKTTDKESVTEDAHSSAVNYMIYMNGSTGQPAVVQSAAWYLCNMWSDDWSSEQFRLIIAACFWIGSKLHTRSFDGKRVVYTCNRAFTAHDLVLAEIEVLHKLKFPTQPIIPQDFIPYLSRWCDVNYRMTESAATFLCLCGLTVSKSIGLEYASVVAVASVKTALMLLQKEEQGVKLEKCPIYHLAMRKSDTSISSVCSTLRESLRVMTAGNYKYIKALKFYSYKPHCLAQILANANENIPMNQNENN